MSGLTKEQIKRLKDKKAIKVQNSEIITKDEYSEDKGHTSK